MRTGIASLVFSLFAGRRRNRRRPRGSRITSNHDAGSQPLPNAETFQQEAARSIARALEQQGPLAVACFTVNGYESTVAALGIDAGNELLTVVAARVRASLRGPDMLARLDGEQFAILVHDASREDVGRVASRIFASVGKPITLRGHSLTASLSTGAALCPEHGGDCAVLMRCADAATHAAHVRGGGLAIYDAAMAGD
jgi:diguanylate cyclase (GGDEF)-like protein